MDSWPATPLAMSPVSLEHETNVRESCIHLWVGMSDNSAGESWQSGTVPAKPKESKETIRLRKQTEFTRLTSNGLTGTQTGDSPPPGLTSKASATKSLCFPDGTTVVCPSKARCQYCHALCCRSDVDHQSHRCAQHVNW